MYTDTTEEILIEREARVRLDRDLRQSAAGLSQEQARDLVDRYYTMQRQRIRSKNQIKAAEKRGEAHELLDWVLAQMHGTERGIKVSLQVYAEAHELGRWLLSIYGIGPVIAAGLLAHLDQNPPAHVGHWYRFAGLVPGVVWKKGQRRPWNADLKTLLWKAAESFVKHSGHEDCVYGHMWSSRKAYEWEQNKAGAYKSQAIKSLEEKKFGRDTDARVWYEGRLTAEAADEMVAAPFAKRPKLLRELAGEIESGVRMLPPGRIQLRAERWAAKILLSHVHQVAWEIAYDTPAPDPYPFSHLGHADRIDPPGWESKFAKNRGKS